MYHNVFDSHSHSENSPDGAHSVTFMAECAIKQGVQGLAVTDHCDCELLEELHYETRLRQTALDVAMARAAFRNRIILTTGLELGQPHLDLAGAERVLAMQHFDFVLLSLHRMRGWRDFFDIDYQGFSPQDLHEMMLQYFAELLEIVRWGRFDVLAHMSFPLRYPKLYNDISLDFTRYAPQIDTVLQALVQQGKGLEINTSGLRSALGEPLPPAWVLRRFRELGGELVTIGSDAHRAGDIGAGIPEAMQLLQDCGYDSFAFYRDRRPVLLRII